MRPKIYMKQENQTGQNSISKEATRLFDEIWRNEHDPETKERNKILKRRAEIKNENIEDLGVEE